MEKITIEEGMKINGYHLSTIVGDSMMPLLRNRTDMVKIVPVDGRLKKYDLPLYKRPTGEYVLHRIVGVKKNHYIICGDNRFVREKVPFHWIVGVTETIYRDDQEISVNDPQYMKYVKKICRTFWLRRIKRKIENMKHHRKLVGK
ncbi:MAG: S24/S26 family peptidase [Eubacterium sp.]